ncbi:hypothetical protein [Neptuniibacter halophilus]|uniref:hypothetical protein n=1 Tax=Neptuniibacter halophilus TaxID=651666 RepID=UPI00257292A2|nr:hypothetical protein [Neptuniibacter halophilus]
MHKAPYRNITLLLSIFGVALYCYFLISPVLLLPADPHFGRLTIGRPSIQIDGESWIPIYGLYLVMKIGLENVLMLALVIFTTVVILFLSPFVAYFRKKIILISISLSVIVNLFGLGAAITIFTPYFENMAITSGFIAMLLLLAALFFRLRVLKTMGE